MYKNKLAVSFSCFLFNEGFYLKAIEFTFKLIVLRKTWAKMSVLTYVILTWVNSTLNGSPVIWPVSGFAYPAYDINCIFQTRKSFLWSSLRWGKIVIADLKERTKERKEK